MRAADLLEYPDKTTLETGMRREGWFDKPAETTKAAGQEFVEAGAFKLVADPHELAFAKAAAAACEGGERKAGRFAAFSALAERAALGLNLGGAERAKSWTEAIALASKALSGLGDQAPKPGSLAVELHSHGVGSFWRELLDLPRFLAAVKAAEAERRADEREDGAAGAKAASKIHALAKFGGPSFMKAAFGDGTERILVGTGNSDRVEAFLELAGEALKASAPERLANRSAAGAGKGFALLHEAFHMSQSWERRAKGDARPLLPKNLGWCANPEALVLAVKLSEGRDDELLDAGRRKASKESGRDAGLRWACGMLSEAWADLMAARALAGEDPKELSRVCAGLAKWRREARGEVKARKVKATLGEKALAWLMDSKKDVDPHQTDAALDLMAELAGKFDSMPEAQAFAEAVKACALGGLGVKCGELASKAEVPASKGALAVMSALTGGAAGAGPSGETMEAAFERCGRICAEKAAEAAEAAWAGRAKARPGRR